jgi:hypothetical protein
MQAALEIVAATFGAATVQSLMEVFGSRHLRCPTRAFFDDRLELEGGLRWPRAEALSPGASPMLAA